MDGMSRQPPSPSIHQRQNTFPNTKTFTRISSQFRVIPFKHSHRKAVDGKFLTKISEFRKSIHRRAQFLGKSVPKRKKVFFSKYFYFVWWRRTRHKQTSRKQLIHSREMFIYNLWIAVIIYQRSMVYCLCHADRWHTHPTSFFFYEEWILSSTSVSIRTQHGALQRHFLGILYIIRYIIL